MYGPHQGLNGFYGCKFSEINIRVLGKTAIYKTENEVFAGTGDIIHVTMHYDGISSGFYCVKHRGEQPDGQCFDYEVRFCCP